jgi:hypothetical protein
LARCRLVIDDKIFLDIYQLDSDARSGLEELRDKVAKDHILSTFFNQPMPGYPDYQNKIWKWDFAPKNTSGATRKGWRLFAKIELPADPAKLVIAVPFLVFDRSEAPTGNPAKYVSEALKKYAEHVFSKDEPDAKFRHQVASGKILSLCLHCFATVLHSDSVEEIEAAELAQNCA